MRIANLAKLDDMAPTIAKSSSKLASGVEVIGMESLGVKRTKK